MFKKIKEIKVIDGIIPYEEIDDSKDITFIVITKDEEVLTKSLGVITEVYKQNKDRNFNVVISSDYDKLSNV